MHLKKRVSFILFLFQLSLLSIGFASWYIGNDASSANKIVEGGIKTEDITNINECITPTTPEPENNFIYGEYGFTDSNNNYVKNCNVFAEYVLNLDLCRIVYNGFDSLYVTVSIEYNDDVAYNLFENDFDYFTFDCEIKYNDVSVSIDGTPTIANNMYMVNFNLNNVLNGSESKSKLSINLVWNIEETFFYDEDNNLQNYFNAKVYPELGTTGENKVNFILGTSIVGI